MFKRLMARAARSIGTKLPRGAVLKRSETDALTLLPKSDFILIYKRALGGYRINEVTVSHGDAGWIWRGLPLDVAPHVSFKTRTAAIIDAVDAIDGDFCIAPTLVDSIYLALRGTSPITVFFDIARVYLRQYEYRRVRAK